MKIVITGATGFIGTALCKALTEAEHEVIALTRHASAQQRLGDRVSCATWDGQSAGEWEKTLDGADAVVNLAGESIAARWNAAKKEKIRASRVNATRALVQAMSKAHWRPKVLVNGSAVGYYGPRGDEELTEESSPGNDFLAEVCQAWEAAAVEAEPLGVRVVRLRIGVVLGEGGGALSKMLPPFKMGVGGPTGSGQQWMSWVHRDDVVGLIQFALERDDVQGALNATAPNPVRNREFAQTLGKVLHRPAFLPTPALAMRLLFGEMADALLLTGQRVLPAAAQRLGYQFRYPDLMSALQAVLKK
ncbi:MAG: TIGR01777 family oxidoreductase [Abditibacteriales bacterium]|nr:TIGR01777 family oxidoreductase [Abditibacteriales bacterium]MDW8364819.1 TIGR01777 family oxidoreductase [Abditibacteriales bacterium]